MRRHRYWKSCFPLICIMRFCKKEKLKSANLYASINSIFLKILRSSAYWCFIWNIRRHRVKTREQECGDRALFSVRVLFCAHDGPTRPETAKKSFQKPFFSLFWVGFSELFKKNSVWNRLRGFFERSKKPDFAKKQPFFGLRLSLFRLFSRLFRGFLFLSKRLKKAWKKPFLRIFELILPLAQGKNAEKPTKEQRTRVPGRIQTKNLTVFQEILPKIGPARLYANDARTKNA